VDVEIISVQGWKRCLLPLISLLLQRWKTFPIAMALYQTAFRPVMDRVLKGADLVHYFGTGAELLAAPDRPGDLVEKLRLLLEQPELAVAMGARGREFSRGYSWNGATQSCLEAYSQAQQNQRQQPRS
jgi:hypothetical protein